MSENIKQIIILRKDLKMRKGKYINQACHSVMKLFLDSCKKTEISSETKLEFVYDKGSTWDLWLNGIFTKIVVSVNSEEELLELYNTAKEKGLPCSLIEDVGLTEFHGVKTLTAVAIGPDNSDEIDKITGHLPLL